MVLTFSDRTQLVSARDTAGVRMWLDIGHLKSYDGTKMSYQKDTEDKDDRSFRTPSKAKAEKKYRKSTGRRLKRARGGEEE